ncbi:MAG: DUF4276 family protein [Acidobacteria bacterium]|nr:DUF4276 family protein [Acidobacteriota bacterium]
MKIQPIVEGHGEVEALPVLLRRFIDAAQVWTVGVGQPIRRPRNRLVQEDGVRQAVRLALEQPECGAVLVLLDGNTDCPAELGPTVQRWAIAAADDTPCRVVLAHREYEAWFLASIESLRGFHGVTTNAQPHPDPEGPRGAKEQLRARMQPGAIYLPTVDQPAFSSEFSLAAAYRGCRSFRKLADSFASLIRAMGHDITTWPPPAWIEDV